MLRSDYKTHYKMYKAKKNVVYATMFTFAMLGGLGLTQTAKADTVENASSQPTVQTTVNSTVQATSQAVVNSAASSVAPVSQVSSTSSSVSSAAPVAQTSQPASTAAVNTFNVTQNSTPVTNVTQSYVQTNQNNQAQNVKATLKLQDQPTGNTMTTADVSLSFDLTADQLHNTQPIQIGTFGTDSSNNGYKLAIQVFGTADNTIKRNGITYGDLKISTATNQMHDSNGFAAVVEFYPAANLSDIVGTQHFSISLPNELNVNYQTSPAAFDSNGTLNTNLIFTDVAGRQTTFDHISLRVPKAATTMGEMTNPHMLNTLTAMRFNSGLVRADQNNWLTFSNINEFNQFINSGNNIDILKLRPTIQDAMRIAPDPNQTLGLSSNNNTSIIRAYIVNDDGTISTESFELPYRIWKPIRLQNAGDNQSLNDLKNKAFNGISFSRQSDGSYIIYTNVNSADLINNIDYNQLRSYLKLKSFQINFHEKDPEKALDNTINAIKHGLLVYDNAVCLYPTDPTLAAHLNIERLDLNTGQPNGETNSAFTIPSSSMASGQSAVKLHVINATNGADLKQVTNFVDWPNQGKKASLSIPSLAGYQVVNDASEANAILSKLGKQGNVLTSATSVDYPAADQISNYYVIMNPVTEHATVHFIDQTDNNKELSHVDLSGAYNTPVTANGQINTMLTNYLNNQGYELVSNDLTGNHLYTDQAQNFNIVLRHKLVPQSPDNNPDNAVKNITRTINVHNPDGSVKTTKQTARLTRTGTMDEATKQTTWSAWSTGNWAEFDVPAIQDYTPSQAKVNAQAVDSNTQDQTVDVTYKANILTKDITFTVPEVIHRTDQHGKTTIDRNQTVTLKGTVTYNAATNQLVSYQIHSTDFPEYVIPQIDGYTSHVQEDHIVSLIPDDTQFDKDAFTKDPSGYFNQIMKGRQGGLDHVIDATSVPQTTAMQYKDGSLDRSYDFYITYTANPQSAQVIYYDTILKKNVSTSTLNGVTDQTVNTDIKVPTNYVLVPGQNLPTTYTFKGSNNQNIIVNLTHATKDTTSTDANAHKTVTRTIIVNTPHDGTKTTKQDAHLTRSATLDLVTNQTAYGNWNTDQWAQYTVPAVAGYTPSQANVPQATVTGDTQNTTVTVNYTANPHVQVINYVGDGKVQHTQNVNGVTDQTVNNIPSEVPANWVLAPGAKVPTSVTFGPNDPQPIVVNIVHKTQDVTKSDEGAHKTITRTIHVNDPHHGTTTTTQAANLTRPAWFDFVTNDVHYGNWNTGNWAEFDSPAVAGYTVNPAKVNAQTVTSDMKDTIVNVNYTANPQQVVLNFVDKSGNVIATHIYKGVTDGTAKIDAQVPTNWVLVKGQTVPTSYTFKPSDNTDIDVIIEHGTKDTSKTDKNAVRDVTRTININDPHKGTATTKQVAHLHRSATLDLVTNETTYGKWDTDANDWIEVAVPAVDGYTPNMTKVNAATVDENTKDQTIDVNYTANPQQVVLNFVDKAGNVIASQTYKGVTDGTASIDAKVPTNWVLVKDQTIPTSYTFKAEGNNDINVQIEHGMEDVSKTDEGAHKDVTRTIIVTNPNGKKNTTSQVAKLTRTAIKDLVTGNVTYGDWNTGNWDAFDTPAIAGYDATIKHVDAQAVNDKTEDATVNISYNALTHTQDINYVDDNGNVVGTQVVTGRTGETSDFTPDVPDGYSIVEGQNIPKNFTFGANDPKTLVIHVTKPNNKPVTPGTPTSDNTNSQTPADSNSSNVITPTSNAVSDSTITPSAPTTNGGTVQTGYATPASAQTVTATPAAAIAPSAQTNNTQGQLPQTGDNNTEAIAGLTLAGMTGAILAAGALKRRHD